MKLVVQRVSRAEVRVDGATVGRIGKGMLVLLGAERGDTAREAEEAAHKLANLRIFEDAAGKMNLALADAGGAVLAVSQFTLLADLSRGRRPGFEHAAKPDVAQPLYERFCATLETAGFEVQRGIFGAFMEVELVNDGPSTFVVEIPPPASPATSRTEPS
jgi:D-tyrosyl-tRNA(Tyr) deacylase